MRLLIVGDERRLTERTADGLRPGGEETVTTRAFRAGDAHNMQVRHRVGDGGGDVAVEAISELRLSVVRWVTELHGGRVRLLDSDQGAQFEVTLPAHGAARKTA